MVKKTFHIAEEHVEAFLNFIKTLDYVQVDDDSVSFELSDAQKEELDKRRENATDDDFMSINESNDLLNKKYGL